ncbi:MAG TPA: RDD family protein [Burkholderiales bacterium]|nr:RDD family protein [Burkholderiales bacterium]
MNYGGFWIRFLAYLVDSFIVTVGFVGIMLLLSAMGLELAGAEIIFLVLSILYWALMQSSKQQATLGKALCGLKVGGPNGERISAARALGREAAKIISSLTLLIGFVIAAFTRNKQALHDFVASTYVVRASEGKVVAALGVALLALCAPVIAVMLMGGAVIESFTAGLSAGMLGEQPVAMHKPAPQAPKPAAAPVPKTVAEAPKPAAEVPKAVAAAPAPAPAQAVPVSLPPQPVAKAPEAPKPAPIAVKPAPMAVKEPPKPEPVVQAPAPEPVKQAPEPEPKLAAEPVVVPMVTRVAAGPVVESKLRFNDLVTAVLYQDAGAVNDLLAFGKWPDKADSTGMTPLMIAASLGQTEIAAALLKAGADPQRTGPAGVTAISIARERKDAALLGLLQGKR